MDRVVPPAALTTRLVIRRHVDFALVDSALCICGARVLCC